MLIFLTTLIKHHQLSWRWSDCVAISYNDKCQLKQPSCTRFAIPAKHLGSKFFLAFHICNNLILHFCVYLTVVLILRYFTVMAFSFLFCNMFISLLNVTITTFHFLGRHNECQFNAKSKNTEQHHKKYHFVISGTLRISNTPCDIISWLSQ